MFQKDLLDLFDSFRIMKVEDYRHLQPGDKPYFIRRLYKVFTSDTPKMLLDLRVSGGVKFHFGVSGFFGGSGANIPNETFLKKMTFFSNRNLITFPFREITDVNRRGVLARRSRGEKAVLFGDSGTGRNENEGYVVGYKNAYSVDPVSLGELIRVICNLRPAISVGAANVLPFFPESRKVFRDKKLGLTSVNFRLKNLQMQFEESETVDDQGKRKRSGLTQLLLPHFENVTFERIIEIRAKEEELYWEFQRRLENLLHRASQVESERLLLSFMKDVDEGVREINRKFTELQVNYRRKNIYMTVKFLSVAMVLMAPVEAREVISAVLGSTTIFEYLTTREDRARELYKSRNNKFYLPWLVFKAGQ